MSSRMWRLMGSVTGNTEMGKWIERTVDWRAGVQCSCGVCGRPLPGRVWLVKIDGQAKEFCDPSCERLYRDYWVPRYSVKEDG
jgi:hypothetical protein